MNSFFEDVASEYRRSRVKFPPMHSAHEGYAILLEEVEEVWEEVKHKTTYENFYNELVQVAAMAYAMVMECK